MWIDVEFKYGEPVVAAVYHKDGVQFMKSEVKVKVTKRPDFDPNFKYSYSETRAMAKENLDKWKEKTIDKISQAVLKSLPEELYGTININIKGLD